MWALVTAITNYEIGFIAVAVGFLTGFMVRKFGHGFERHFGFMVLFGHFLAVSQEIYLLS